MIFSFNKIVYHLSIKYLFMQIFQCLLYYIKLFQIFPSPADMTPVLISCAGMTCHARRDIFCSEIVIFSQFQVKQNRQNK